MSRRASLAIAAFTLLGLALRCAAAQGALWLDEAWSAVMAQEAGTPLGVFLAINHDNNHHLNTLWLQLVGPGAPPVVQRALAIASGTLAIPVAAAIAGRRGPFAAVFAALLFAVSPLLVTYGAEARGYAPMLLAVLVLVQLVARWLEDPRKPVPAVPVAVTVLLGMLAQLTMVFALAALTLWVAVALLATRPRHAALIEARRMLVPALFPAVLVLVLVLGAAWAHGGMQIGNYEPFRFAAAIHGQIQLAEAAFGALWLFPVVLGLAALAQPELRQWVRPQGAEMFFLIALLVPLGVLLLQLGNSGMPRYYLLSGVAAAMLAAMLAGGGAEAGGWRALVGGGAIVAAVAWSLAQDATLIRNRRGDPGQAVAAMARRAPQGADVGAAKPRALAVVQMAAAAARYPARVIETDCPAPRFLFVDRDGDAPFPAFAERCAARYRPIAEGHPAGLSGTHWKLYERVAEEAR